MFQIIFWEDIFQFPVNYLTRENLLCHLNIWKILTLCMFWLLRTSLTTILHRIFEIRKESCWVVSLVLKLFCPDNCYDKVKDSQPCQHYFQWLLHNFWPCPLLSSNMSLSMFWLLRLLTMILQRIFEIRKESCWVVSLIFK